MPSLRSICFVPVLFVATLLCASAASVAGVLDRRRRWALGIVPFWSRLLLASGGVQVRVSGETAELLRGRAVFVANHESYLDIPVLSSLLPQRSLWLAKRELFWIPVFGQGMRAVGQIPVDRSNQEAARASIEAAAGEVARGFSVTIFPEGTRSADGTLRPFKLGFAHLAAASGAPVVPLVLRGSGSLWPKGAWGARPGTVEVTVLGPLLPPQSGDADALRRFAEQVRSAMLAAVEDR
ncbi:MAG TPA: lysophospholipid acyltransferase family protein [Deferrisomatales bacterium]|nr:lysophospholipid acyltransferase family protein [Deferrisomatales bacterium]